MIYLQSQSGLMLRRPPKAAVSKHGAAPTRSALILRDALAEFIIGPAEGRTRWLGLLRMRADRRDPVPANQTNGRRL
jgi:hypothetical protein